MITANPYSPKILAVKVFFCVILLTQKQNEKSIAYQTNLSVRYVRKLRKEWIK
jgi:hypothetical protein